MELLRFVITFTQVIIKGCVESPAVRTVLIMLAPIAAIVFIPYRVGLLIANTVLIGPVLTGILGPAWPIGMLSIIMVSIVVAVIVMVYIAVYNAVKERMGEMMGGDE